MKYAIIDQTLGDCFATIYDTAAEAIENADYEWRTMTRSDKKRRLEFYVVSFDPEKMGEDDCLHDFVQDVIKDYLRIDPLTRQSTPVQESSEEEEEADE